MGPRRSGSKNKTKKLKVSIKKPCKKSEADNKTDVDENSSEHEMSESEPSIPIPAKQYFENNESILFDEAPENAESLNSYLFDAAVESEYCSFQEENKTRSFIKMKLSSKDPLKTDSQNTYVNGESSEIFNDDININSDKRLLKNYLRKNNSLTSSKQSYVAINKRENRRNYDSTVMEQEVISNKNQHHKTENNSSSEQEHSPHILRKRIKISNFIPDNSAKDVKKFDEPEHSLFAEHSENFRRKGREITNKALVVEKREKRKNRNDYKNKVTLNTSNKDLTNQLPASLTNIIVNQEAFPKKIKNKNDISYVSKYLGNSKRKSGSSKEEFDSDCNSFENVKSDDQNQKHTKSVDGVENDQPNKINSLNNNMGEELSNKYELSHKSIVKTKTYARKNLSRHSTIKLLTGDQVTSTPILGLFQKSCNQTNANNDQSNSSNVLPVSPIKETDKRKIHERNLQSIKLKKLHTFKNNDDEISNSSYNIDSHKKVQILNASDKYSKQSSHSYKAYVSSENFGQPSNSKISNESAISDFNKDSAVYTNIKKHLKSRISEEMLKKKTEQKCIIDSVIDDSDNNSYQLNDNSDKGSDALNISNKKENPNFRNMADILADSSLQENISTAHDNNEVDEDDNSNDAESHKSDEVSDLNETDEDEEPSTSQIPVNNSTASKTATVSTPQISYAFVPINYQNSLNPNQLILGNPILQYPQYTNQNLAPNTFFIQPQGAFQMQNPSNNNYFLSPFNSSTAPSPQTATFPVFQARPAFSQVNNSHLSNLSNSNLNANSMLTGLNTAKTNKSSSVIRNIKLFRSKPKFNEDAESRPGTSNTSNKDQLLMSTPKVVQESVPKLKVNSISDNCNCLNSLLTEATNIFSRHSVSSDITVKQLYSLPNIKKLLLNFKFHTSDFDIPSGNEYVFSDSFLSSTVREVMKDYVDYHMASLHKIPCLKDEIITYSYKYFTGRECFLLSLILPTENVILNTMQLVNYFSFAAILSIIIECKRRVR